MANLLGRLGRVIAIMLVAVATVVTLGAGRGWAARGGNPGPNDGPFDPGSDTEANHCISPLGVDLNERYGISEQIVALFCDQVDTGEFWTPAAVWIMNTFFEVTPPGFVPAGATPLEDFLAKFAAAKYVVDPGSRQERTYVYQKSSRLWTGEIDGLPAVNTVTLSRLKPLKPGQHVVQIYWVFSATHCDGLGDVPADNCLPAGETLYNVVPFEVTAPAPQSGH
jgi:hypothetical protein